MLFDERVTLVLPVPDRTLLLTTHAGLVLTRKERNRLQHAKEGNTARERDLADLHSLTSADPVLRDDPEGNSSQDSEAHDGGEIEMDAAPTSPLSREAREDMSVAEGQSQQDEDEDALFSPAEQQPSEADGPDPATPVSDGPVVNGSR